MSRPHKGRQRSAAGQASPGAIDEKISALAGLTIGELRAAWTRQLGTTPPTVRSRNILRGLFAWQIQAQRLGDLDSATERKLRDIAQALEQGGTYEPKIRRNLSAGIVLTREWKGTLYKVTATAEGFQHAGKHYKSMSDIARMITGTRWSGPRFFGLEQKKARSPRQAEP